MNWTPRKDSFHEDDLEKVPDLENPVILKSGGPIMEVLTEDEEACLCEWRGDSGKLWRKSYPRVCLYRLVPFE